LGGGRASFAKASEAEGGREEFIIDKNTDYAVLRNAKLRNFDVYI